MIVVAKQLVDASIVCVFVFVSMFRECYRTVAVPERDAELVQVDKQDNRWRVTLLSRLAAAASDEQPQGIQLYRLSSHLMIHTSWTHFAPLLQGNTAWRL